jgi:hypothetical protein
LNLIKQTRWFILAAALTLPSACGGPASGREGTGEPAGREPEAEPEEYEPTGGCHPAGDPCRRYRTLVA